MSDENRQREQLEQLMEDLGHAVVRAMSSSDDVARAMRRIRKQGVSMSLLLDCQIDDESGAKVQIETPRRPESVPQFRLGTTDVSWLRSLGIDATRRGRARKKNRADLGASTSHEHDAKSPNDSPSPPASDTESGRAPSRGDQ